jgi:hypothetical protein
MKYMLPVVFSFCCLLANAQKIENKTKLNIDFIKFFEGNWVGKGEFFNGKKIEATASFKLSLDSCWITYTHEDTPPNRYKALSMWGIDKPTGKFLTYVFDNFQGHRLFTSNGWKADSLVLVYKDESSTNVMFQRFVYSKISPDRFKMAFEVSKDSAIWKLGDWLIFRKTDN